MNAYRYTNGTLELIEVPETTDLKWTPMGDMSAKNDEDYVWHCGLPSEETVGDTAEGFNIAVYRAASNRTPYPFVAIVGFGGECGEEIYFPQLGDLIRYTREHAPLLQLTLLAGVADRIEEAMKWLFHPKEGLFRDHVQEVNYRAYQEAQARRAKRAALATSDGRSQPQHESARQ
ncbi:MAG: hypothetical protein WBL61_06820 [Bryobacteraceae bacterium]